MDARPHVKPVVALLIAAAVWSGCEASEAGEPGSNPVARDPNCPETRRLEPPLAGVTDEEQTLEYWLVRAESYGPLDAPLLDSDDVRRHNLALSEPVDGEPLGQSDLRAPPDSEALARQVRERLAYMRDRLENGTLVDGSGDVLSTDAQAAFAEPASLTLAPEYRVAEELVALRCGPHPSGLYKTPVDEDFDRNRCSTIRPGEVVQLLAPPQNGLALARTPYTLGWVSTDELAPLTDEEAVAKLDLESRALTRRDFLTEAFSFLGSPYGWGGKDGGYDCSRFLLEVFGRFGLGLPRHSARQALAGTFSIDVSEVSDPAEKKLILEAAARRGVTLLQFPGHIMLYLGTNDEGVPMAIHALSEFLTRCDDGQLETVNRIDRVAISDLTLGDGSSREDLLSRITRVTVFGAGPGPALKADAKIRPAAPVTRPEGACRDSQAYAIFRSPSRPNEGQPLRVVATSGRSPGAAALVLFDPEGNRVGTPQHRLDGPPHSRYVEVASPTPGRWTAVLADGDRELACHRFIVARHPPRAVPRTPDAPAWSTTRAWSPSVENFYAAFIEQLFRDPLDEDATWSRLQEVVDDPERNLLYDYRLPGEDARLSLKPDCADLPYFLRAYFAWKLGLPFTYRTCTRGGRATPPTCEPIVFSNLDPVEAATDVGAFRKFSRMMGGVVHSSSPRTLPEDENTDFYPVRLRRTALRPGTVFADPYGHVLVVARWKPQGVTDYGVLIGADAQPDGTVGRRRFWRGSFLFTPETELVGAGFKGWRPVVFDPDTQALTLSTNDELGSVGARAWSRRQYDGTADDFYSAVEGMINPRPLDPAGMQRSLVDALAESVERRLNSVDNGESFMKEHGYATIDMPRGRSLFLTSGPWEDYSTPSRDMRLLISIDAVTGFPDQVAAHPARFGVDPEKAEATAAEVRSVLATELADRSFVYTRSNGTPFTLTLADLIARADALEVAYNPNDCAEVRWGAKEGTEEYAPCERRAPDAQSQRMLQYRDWFRERKRPQ